MLQPFSTMADYNKKRMCAIVVIVSLSLILFRGQGGEIGHPHKFNRDKYIKPDSLAMHMPIPNDKQSNTDEQFNLNVEMNWFEDSPRGSSQLTEDNGRPKNLSATDIMPSSSPSGSTIYLSPQPSDDDFTEKDCLDLHLSKTKLPLTYLASFPGSGNTWVRHLLQQASGKCSLTL